MSILTLYINPPYNWVNCAKSPNCAKRIRLDGVNLRTITTYTCTLVLFYFFSLVRCDTGFNLDRAGHTGGDPGAVPGLHNRT